MGLRKTEIIYNGDTVEYHRIAEFEIDMATGACVCILHSWSSAADRGSLKPPKLNRRFNFLWTGENMAESAYSAIKAIPYWSNAEDV